MFSGKIDGLRGTRHQVLSRVIHSLESAGVQVTRTESGVRARVPGMESRIFSVPPVASEHFDDHLEVSVCDEGKAVYRWLYWTRFQAGLHALIAAMFAMDIWLRGTPSADLVPAFLAAQLVPTIIFFFSTQLRARTLFEEQG